MKRILLLISIMCSIPMAIVAMDPHLEIHGTLFDKDQAMRKADYVAKKIFFNKPTIAQVYSTAFQQAILLTGKYELSLVELKEIILGVFAEYKSTDKAFDKSMWSQIILNYLLENDIKTICSNCARQAIQKISTDQNFGCRSTDVFKALMQWVDREFFRTDQARDLLIKTFKQILETQFPYATQQVIYENLANWVNSCECHHCPKTVKMHNATFVNNSPALRKAENLNNTNNNNELPLEQPLIQIILHEDVVVFNELLDTGFNPRTILRDGLNAYGLAKQHQKFKILDAIINWSFKEVGEKHCPICMEERGLRKAVATKECLHFICGDCKDKLTVCSYCFRNIEKNK